jgi:hypothetical protein
MDFLFAFVVLSHRSMLLLRHYHDGAQPNTTAKTRNKNDHAVACKPFSFHWMQLDHLVNTSCKVGLDAIPDNNDALYGLVSLAVNDG